jgi:uncharacterized protein (TIGR00369 family)
MMDIQTLKQFYLDLPFNKFLGLKILTVSNDKATLTFSLKPEFIGNTYKQILHGGVISSVMDASGGLMALISLFHKLDDLSHAEVMQKLSRSSTIDLRVDYLRPGSGQAFTIETELLRSGKRIAVIRMEMYNEVEMIATGAATYLLGQN